MLELPRHDGMGAGQPRVVLHQVWAIERGASVTSLDSWKEQDGTELGLRRRDTEAYEEAHGKTYTVIENCKQGRGAFPIMQVEY